MVRQLTVHDKWLRFCVFMCQNLWNQKTGRRIAQTTVDYSIWEVLQQFVYRRCRIQEIEHLKKS